MNTVRFTRHFSFLLLSTLMFSVCGCAALPLATLGTVLGSAGAAASAGSEVYSLGKLNFSLMASFDQARNAAVDATNDLHLHILDCKFVNKRTNEMEIEIEDDLHKKAVLHIDARSAKLCQCGMDVGIFGFEPTAKLLVDRIRAHLPENGGNASVNVE